MTLNSPLDEFAVSATRVYFTEGPELRRMQSVAIDGSDLGPGAFGFPTPALITHAANSLYGVVPGNILRQTPADDSSNGVELITASEGYALEPLDIAVNANYAAWTNGGDDPSIGRVPLEGGEPLVSRSAIGSRPRAIAVDGTHAYWTADNIGAGISLERAPLGVGSLAVLASGLEGVVDLAVHAGQIYLLINSPNVQSLARIPSVGGGVTTLATIHATCMAVDSTGIYLGGAGQDQNAVIHYSLDGQVETMLAAGAFLAKSIQLDANNVYWLSTLDGIRSTAKMP